MNMTIEIGGKDMEFRASAATSILFKKTFGKDLMSEFSSYVKHYKEVKQLKDDCNINDDDTDEVKAQKATVLVDNPIISELSIMAMDLFPKLAYIMWLEANEEQRELFKKLNENDFILWLGQLDSNDIKEHLHDFMSLWNGNSKTTVKLKN